jgi:hypothetical protein
LVLYTLLAFSLMTIRPMPPAMDLFLCANLRASCVVCRVCRVGGTTQC